MSFRAEPCPPEAGPPLAEKGGVEESVFFGITRKSIVGKLPGHLVWLLNFGHCFLFVTCFLCLVSYFRFVFIPTDVSVNLITLFIIFTASTGCSPAAVSSESIT